MRSFTGILRHRQRQMDIQMFLNLKCSFMAFEVVEWVCLQSWLKLIWPSMSTKRNQSTFYLLHGLLNGQTSKHGVLLFWHFDIFMFKIKDILIMFLFLFTIRTTWIPIPFFGIFLNAWNVNICCLIHKLHHINISKHENKPENTHSCPGIWICMFIFHV